jgi:UDP-N-acetylglucosamine--N-acetylmuramyl-(pentapeptide) pyrophosphoryl-undecaprenol N-acetylglucosamine transferase
MRALIASSATGGHIYPALAIADAIKKRDSGSKILFVGATWEIGKDIVSSAGYDQVYINVSGIDRKNPLNIFKTLRDLIRASSEVKKIIRDFKPDICIGTGGHIAGPVIRGARKAGVRTIIQEQNVIPGIANKLSEKYADKIFVGFDDTAKYFKDNRKVVISGNPVRPVFSDIVTGRKEFRDKYGVPEGAFCLFFFGGSQGAEAINAAAADAVEHLSGHYYTILITGKDYYADFQDRYTLRSMAGLCLFEYSDSINELFAAADLIISRAGALTVTEIMLSGKASILIPSPNVTNNHQYFNAKVLSDRGAALLLTEDGIKDGRLAKEIVELASNPENLERMNKAASEMAKPDALKVIIDEIFGS